MPAKESSSPEVSGMERLLAMLLVYDASKSVCISEKNSSLWSGHDPIRTQEPEECMNGVSKFGWMSSLTSTPKICSEIQPLPSLMMYFSIFSNMYVFTAG